MAVCHYATRSIPETDTSGLFAERRSEPADASAHSRQELYNERLSESCDRTGETKGRAPYHQRANMLPWRIAGLRRLTGLYADLNRNSALCQTAFLACCVCSRVPHSHYEPPVPIGGTSCSSKGRSARSERIRD